MKGKIKSLLREGLLDEVQTVDMAVYHGSTTKISKFTDDFVGGEEAVDQEGPGIYFTTSKENAKRYGENIYTAKINADGFLESDKPSTSVNIEEVIQLIKMAEDWEGKAQNFAENPEDGARMAAEGAIDYNDNEKDVFLQVWIEFYRYEPVQYVRNMVKMGYNGIITTPWEEYDIKHLIVYNPAVIQVK